MLNSYVHLVNSLSEFNFKTFLSQYSKVIVFADENTNRYCYPLLKEHLPEHLLTIIQSGEEQKTLQTCSVLWNSMTEAGLDRKSFVINLGGGVLGDMGGFCAATYKRGIDFMQIPTTLLSQVDASVGGKLGVDFQDFKNHIGVFQDPQKVIIFSDFLKTLDRDELRSGFAEIIKHALIKDNKQFEVLKNITLIQLQNLDFEFNKIISHSINIKSNVVLNDPTEKGERKILNFGHTLGHAIESFYLPKPNQKLLHGEAIAIGMICESYLSYIKSYITKNELNEICDYILKIYGKVIIPDSDLDSILELTIHDKKNSHGNVKFSLIKSIGNCVFDIIISKIEMMDAIKFYVSK